MFYVVNNPLNDLYVLSNKAIGPGKKSKINKRWAYVYLEARLLYPLFYEIPCVWQPKK